MTQAFTITCDTREKAPYTFTTSGHQVKTSGLTAGDYSVAGLADHIAVERKELSDFIGCVTAERDRFRRELQRLRAFRYRAVVIEASLADIADHRYRSNATPESVLGSLAGWSLRFEVPFFLAGDRPGGERLTLALLRNAHRQIVELCEAVTHTIHSTTPTN